MNTDKTRTWEEGEEKLWSWEEAADAGYTICLLDGCRGVYLPQDYAKFYGDQLTPWAKDTLLSGPEHEHYWAAWDQVLESYFEDEDGTVWSLYQDGDLFLIRDGIEIDWDSVA